MDNTECSHWETATDTPLWKIVKNSENRPCSDCMYNGPNLWICLYRDCLRIGCSEHHSDHSTLHNRMYPSHCLHMNLTTRRLWCYKCEKEVFMVERFKNRLSGIYGDSDNEMETGRSCDHESYDSGWGSYSTLRNDPPERRNSTTLFGFDRNVGLNVGMSGDSCEGSDSDDNSSPADKPTGTGLVGLQNIGNTCYMNSALQTLSNTPPLTSFFLECSPLVQLNSDGHKPGLSRSYQRLLQEIWHPKTRGYVVPSGILYGIRNVHPMFRGYHQHDTQEFLRCFMDQLHEELKSPVSSDYVVSPPVLSGSGSSDTLDNYALASEVPTISDSYEGDGSASASQSEGEYETCDSGVSERSSLSDDTERSGVSTSDPTRKMLGKRRLSRSPSPTHHNRSRCKIGSQHYRSINSSVVESQPSTSSNSQPKKTVKYKSIISDIFDGKLLSSVQCLTCDRVSTRIETFQDLSLPIPSRDHLAVLHGTGLTGKVSGASGQVTSSVPLSCSDSVYPGGVTGHDGWVAWFWSWLKSWFYGPVVCLHDCLAAFFSADELKGDNMYSCEKCNKLRNGVKFSKVLALPEILCVHLKRFRHELMFSSKISSQVSFPLAGLDMRPYLHKDCVSSVSSYNLIGVICHHGTAGGGHYTCYCLNPTTSTWFEFDDQYVTQVSPETVQACEAYVLFYRKSDEQMSKIRQHAVELMEASAELNEPKYYISRQWITKFSTCAEPGPIDNSDFLCVHGGVIPDRYKIVNHLTSVLTQSVYEYLFETFGGGPACNHLSVCSVCEKAAEALRNRIESEMQTFVQLNLDFQKMDSNAAVYAISMNWFRQWQAFVRKTADPPGPIDNSSIVNAPGQPETLKPGSDYAEISEDLWNFFHHIYGGGPVVKRKSGKPQKSASTTNIPQSVSEPAPVSGACSDSVPEFVIPPLKPKRTHETIDSERYHKNIVPVHEPVQSQAYCHGEPMEIDDGCSSLVSKEINESVENIPKSSAVSAGAQ